MRAEDLMPGDVVTSSGEMVVNPPRRRTERDAMDGHIVADYVVVVVHYPGRPGSVALRHWDVGTEIRLHRTYRIEGVGNALTRREAVKAVGGEDALDRALESGYAEDNLTRDEIARGL